MAPEDAMTRWPARAMAAASILGCAVSARPSLMVDPSILSDVSSRESTWTEARTPLAFSAGRASSCATYDRLKGTGLVEDTANQLVKSEYLICDVLKALGTDVELKPMQVVDSYGETLASRLDLRSFPSSLGPRLEDARRTLSSLFEDSELKLGPRSVTVTTSGWSYGLTLVLVGDLDRSGAVDWLVWLTDEASDGNYRGYQTLLIQDVSNSGLLRAAPL